MSPDVCRLCLTKPAVSFSLLETKICQMFESLALSKVNSADKISTIICLKCLLNLKLAYSFQQKIKKSEEKLMQRINIKDERHEEPTQTNKDLVQLCDRKCLICGVTVVETSINDHIREHFNKKHECDFCGDSFEGFQSYKEHLEKHSRQAVYQCKNCEAKFFYKSFYDTHCKKVHCLGNENLHNRIMELGLQSAKSIKVLIKTESRKSSIPKYLQNVDDETSQNALRLGLKSAKSIKLLSKKTTNEQKDDMEDEDRRTCQICFKKFTKKSFAVHSHETKSCNICNKEIPKFSYRRHMEGHILGPQVCHLCGATLQNKNNLRTHLFYSHSQKRYKCDQCDKSFKKKHARDLHVQKTHIGVPTVFCETCGKGFYNLRYLNKHIDMTHLKLRPHICDFCNKGFSTHYALKTHRRQHTNETPYRCEVCGEGFRQNVSLKAHKKSKHKIVEKITCHCEGCGKGFASEVALESHKTKSGH